MSLFGGRELNDGMLHLGAVEDGNFALRTRGGRSLILVVGGDEVVDAVWGAWR